MSFRYALESLYVKDSLPKEMRPLLGFAADLTSGMVGHSVQLLHYRNQSRTCSHPLDAVYALVGIMPVKFAPNIEVDYSRTLLDLSEAGVSRSRLSRTTVGAFWLRPNGPQV